VAATDPEPGSTLTTTKAASTASARLKSRPPRPGATSGASR